MLGDINAAEPNALIGFAGPRVIEQTVRQKLARRVSALGVLWWSMAPSTSLFIVMKCAIRYSAC
jgi:hypothetical protein